MEFKPRPNTRYYKLSLLIHQGAVGIKYPGYIGHFYFDEDLEVPDFYLSEEQYCKRCSACIEDHLRPVLRKYIEEHVLGHEKAEVDENGNIIEETWELIPGYIKPGDFHMYTLPYYTNRAKPEAYITDGDGNLRREEDEAYA